MSPRPEHDVAEPGDTSVRLYLGDGRKAKKDPGYCEREGIGHAWEVMPWINLSYPPQSVRCCTNCGAKQTMRHTEPTWE